MEFKLPTFVEVVAEARDFMAEALATGLLAVAHLARLQLPVLLPTMY
jgi:hypothetical protein